MMQRTLTFQRMFVLYTPTDAASYRLQPLRAGAIRLAKCLAAAAAQPQRCDLQLNLA